MTQPPAFDHATLRRPTFSRYHFPPVARVPRLDRVIHAPARLGIVALLDTMRTPPEDAGSGHLTHHEHVHGTGNGLAPRPGRGVPADAALDGLDQAREAEHGASLVVVELDVLGEEGAHSLHVAVVVGPPERRVEGQDRLGDGLVLDRPIPSA
jgi:hypothetical protein